MMSPPPFGSDPLQEIFGSEGPQLPHPKRRKTDIACNVCKSRKSRCNGARPVCGPCFKRWGEQNSCTYRSNASRRSQQSQHNAAGDQLRNEGPPSSKSSTATPSRQYAFSSASESLAQVPYSAQQQPTILQTHLAERTSQAPFIRNGASNTSGFSTVPSRVDTTNTVTYQGRFSPVPSDGSEEDRDVDAMGCVDGWALRTGLLGSASGASFMRQVRKAADGTDTPDQGRKGAVSGHVSTTLPGLRRGKAWKKEAHNAQLVLPTRKVADQLMTVYWNYSDIIFPWLDKSEIMIFYDSLWSGTDYPLVDEKLFHCMLNLIFAIACKVDPAGRPGEQSELSTVYYKRAKQLLSFDLLDISQFPLIQTMLLTGQYLQSTNMPRQCFQSIGMAIWIAQDMGLHLPETTSSIIDPHDRELARRVWHGCLLMDRIAAMTFGRPARISQDVARQAPFPLAIDSAYLRAPDPQAQTQPAKLDFFIAYCKLHHILGDILAVLYTADDREPKIEAAKSSGRIFTERLDKLFEFDHDLTEWRGALKGHLQLPPQYDDRTETCHFKRQANILHVRYLHLRLLLFRPFFSQARRVSNTASEDSVTSLESQAAGLIVSHCRVLCVEAARQIIELIASNLLNRSSDNHMNVLPTWWYNISYVYTAATVLIAAHMFPTVLEKVPSSLLIDQLQQAFEILGYYEKLTESASRCKSALELIYRKIILPKDLIAVQVGLATHNLRPEPGLSSPTSMPTPAVGCVDIPSFLTVESGDLAWLETALFDWDEEFWQ